jgi:hypothetical protein
VALVLLIVSGRYQGAVVPLPDEAEVVVGRESDLDLVLQEELVSRRHAKFTSRGGEVTVQDLGSTNGTFVNGQKVRRARLAPGDRILVGASLLKLAVAQDGAAAPPPLPKETRKPAAMQGRLEEVPLPDLLQLLASSRKGGVLVLGGGAEARIWLEDGRVVGCVLAAAPSLPPRKAFVRALRIERGPFELGPAGEPPPARLEEPLEALLVDGVRELDELRALGGRLPAPGAALALARPPGAPLRSLAADDLDVLEAALVAGTVQGAVDAAACSDAEAAARLVALVERGVLRAG